MADLSNPKIQALLKHAKACRRALSKGEITPYWEGGSLAGLDLSAAILEGANLTRANLERANLDGAKLYGANLERANLTRAKLYGANFSGANLERANLPYTILKRADLTNANLLGASLYGAKLEGTRFTKGFVLVSFRQNNKLILVSEDRITYITLSHLRRTNHG